MVDKISSSISMETLEELRDLQSEDDPHFVANFLTTVLDALSTRMKNVERAIEEGNASVMADEVHALKSSCLNAGIERMSSLCVKLEALGKAGSLEGAQDLYEELCTEHSLVKEEIASLPELLSAKRS